MHLKNQKDFFCGLLFMALGVAFAWSASHYSVGNAARMGPGYVPVLLGAVLTLLGGVLVFKALVIETEDGGRIAGWAWRPMLAIALAPLVFGVLIAGLLPLGVAPMGLALALFALCVVASLALAAVRWREVLVLAAVLALGGCLGVALLKLPLAVWPAFTGA